MRERGPNLEPFTELIALALAAALAAALGAALGAGSHEIRTPMNGVLGMLQLLLDSPLPAEQRDLASTALRSGEALLGILDDILDFSKIEAGKLAIAPAPFDLRELLEDLVELLAPRAAAGGLSFTLRIAPGFVDRRIGDAGRVRQILTNLVGNAVKFTPSGSVAIDVSDAGGLVSMAVIDTGIGIGVEQQATLFQRFSQADGSTTRRFGGTGLGLAISRQLAELMGGRIDLTSRAGHGSTFKVTLPLGHERPDGAPTPKRLVGKNVWQLDGGAAQGAILSEALRAAGAAVQRFTSIAEASETTDTFAAGDGRDAPDLAIVDTTLEGHAALAARWCERFPALGLHVLVSVLERNRPEALGGRPVAGAWTMPVRTSTLIAVLAGDPARALPTVSPGVTGVSAGPALGAGAEASASPERLSSRDGRACCSPRTTW